MKRFSIKSKVNTDSLDAEIDFLETNLDEVLKIFEKAGWYCKKPERAIQRWGEIGLATGWHPLEVARFYLKRHFPAKWKILKRKIQK